MPEDGQWSELHQGVVSHYPPPDLMHGNVILNLSKSLAQYFEKTRNGYAVFKIGLKTQTDPDSLYFPAVSIFLDGPLFEETDSEFADYPPQLLIEVISTPELREQFSKRAEKLLSWGVKSIWGIDTLHKHALIMTGSQEEIIVPQNATLMDINLMPGLSIPVEHLYRDPTWWQS